MYKFIILLSAAAIACASDVNKIISEATAMTISIKYEGASDQCLKFASQKLDKKCTCKNEKDLTVVGISQRLGKFTGEIIPIIVEKDEDAPAALGITLADCVCSPAVDPEAQVVVLRPVNDNYFLRYAQPEVDGVKLNIVVLSRKNIDSRSDFEAVIKDVGFKKGNYSMLCNEFTD